MERTYLQKNIFYPKIGRQACIIQNKRGEREREKKKQEQLYVLCLEISW